MDDDSNERTERRHRQPGRRGTDRDGFTAAALVEAAQDDSLFPRWRREEVIKWLTIITMIVGLYAGLSTWFAARFATRAEIQSTVKPVADTLADFKAVTAERLRRVETRQDSADAFLRLLPAMARLQCLTLQRDQSGTLGDAAGLPCYRLLQLR